MSLLVLLLYFKLMTITNSIYKILCKYTLNLLQILTKNVISGYGLNSSHYLAFHLTP